VPIQRLGIAAIMKPKTTLVRAGGCLSRNAALPAQSGEHAVAARERSLEPQRPAQSKNPGAMPRGF